MLCLAVVVVVLGVGLAWLVAILGEHGVTDTQFRAGAGLSVSSLVVYGVTIQDRRRHWSSWGYWVVLFAAFLLRTVVLGYVILRTGGWRAFGWMALVPVELFALDVTLDKLGYPVAGPWRHRR